MHLTYIFLLMLYFFPQLFAAPPSSTFSNSSSNTTRPISSHTHSHHLFPTVTRKPPTITIYHPVPAQVSVTRPFRPPAPSHARTPPDTPRANGRSRSQKPIVIFFEVLCGVFALGVLLGILRCVFSYRKTPNRDRIIGVLNRHRLQQELEELERNPISRRRVSLQEPAPPYLPRPPSYVEPDTTTPHAHGTEPEYVEVPTTSPPHSPVNQRRSLEAIESTPHPNHPLTNG